MLWLILALLFVVVGIVLFIYGLRKDDGEPIATAIVIWVITTVVFMALLGRGLDLYGSQLSTVKGLETEIPLREIELANLEKACSQRFNDPKTLGEFKNYLSEETKISELKEKIIKDKTLYTAKKAHLQSRSPWTNIFVFLNGRYTDKNDN